MPTIPSCESAHGTKVVIPKSTSCTGHQGTRPTDPYISSFTLATTGQPIKQSDVQLLRNKISQELNTRLNHPTYSTASISTLRAQMQISHNVGDKLVTGNANEVNSALESIGKNGSPAGVPRGGVVVSNEPTTDEDKYVPVSSEPPKMVHGVNRTYDVPGTKDNVVVVNINTSDVRQSPSTRETDLGSDGEIPTETAVQGQKITADLYNNLRNNYLKLSRDCICHSDCACNAVCACHNNCGCNY